MTDTIGVRLQPGTRVRLRGKSPRDLHAIGTIVEMRRDTAVALMDTHSFPGNDLGAAIEATEGQIEAPFACWIRMRDQEPNPDHIAALPPTLH
jgi:hypothetical protein